MHSTQLYIVHSYTQYIVVHSTQYSCSHSSDCFRLFVTLHHNFSLPYSKLWCHQLLWTTRFMSRKIYSWVIPLIFVANEHISNTSKGSCYNITASFSVLSMNFQKYPLIEQFAVMCHSFNVCFEKKSFSYPECYCLADPGDIYAVLN